jgi:hypothetical protein
VTLLLEDIGGPTAGDALVDQIDSSWCPELEHLLGGGPVAPIRAAPTGTARRSGRRRRRGPCCCSTGDGRPWGFLSHGATRMAVPTVSAPGRRDGFQSHADDGKVSLSTDALLPDW